MLLPAVGDMVSDGVDTPYTYPHTRHLAIGGGEGGMEEEEGGHSKTLQLSYAMKRGVLGH